MMTLLLLLHDWNGICVDSKGNVFFVNADPSAIYKATPEGKVTLFARDDAWKHPHHLSIDGKDNLYFAGG